LAPAGDGEEVVKHPAMRPMWLLRFFTSWGAKWGANQPDADAAKGSSSSETNPIHIQASSESVLTVHK